MKKKLLLLVMVLITLSSCGASRNAHKYGSDETNVQKSNLSVGVIKSQVEKGKTNQAEILELFGAPNLVTKNKNNQEVWSYNRMSQVDKGGVSTFLYGTKASESTSSQSFDFIITFDEADIVEDYSVVSTSF